MQQLGASIARPRFGGNTAMVQPYRVEVDVTLASGQSGVKTWYPTTAGANIGDPASGRTEYTWPIHLADPATPSA
jgi:hypothetical protein